MENRKSNIIILLIYFLGQLAAIAMSIVLVLIMPTILDDDAMLDAASSIIMFIMYLGLTIVFIGVYRTYFINQGRDFSEKLVLHVVFIIGTFFLLLFMAILSSELMGLLGKTDETANQASLERLLEGPVYMKWILIIVTLFFAPIIEEFVFRKGIFGLLNRYHDIIPILLSGFLFGLIHVIGDDIANIIPYAFSGFALSVMYVVSKRNIFVVIGGHMVFNFIALLPLINGV